MLGLPPRYVVLVEQGLVDSKSIVTGTFLLDQGDYRL
jgi:hypothetical protein